MPRYRYPVRANLGNTFYYLYIRFLKLAPMSFLMALLFLLVGFTMSTGYLIKERSAGLAEIPPTVRTNHLPAGPPIHADIPEESDLPRFAIGLGAYVLKDNLENRVNLANRLGQPVDIQIGKKRVSMTRLFLGTYPIKEAGAVLEKLRKIDPDAFLTRQGQGGRKAAVFGGSFYYVSEAENMQKALAQKGFQTTKVLTRQTLPLYSIRMGNFESKKMAVEFIRSAGLSATEMSVVAIN